MVATTPAPPARQPRPVLGSLCEVGHADYALHKRVVVEMQVLFWLLRAGHTKKGREEYVDSNSEGGEGDSGSALGPVSPINAGETLLGPNRPNRIPEGREQEQRSRRLKRQSETAEEKGRQRRIRGLRKRELHHTARHRDRHSRAGQPQHPQHLNLDVDLSGAWRRVLAADSCFQNIEAFLGACAPDPNA
ncbi:hypothetical protein DL546_004029 [Coniochaeta pulveracea]|uniref:Uncharacterized protein n=1 Tax=Coniochaeta pulveracea TaxID=177199 RepID=A0A420Y250_9PEZI|nr:hypothetical protein DL546_004029 [Coniochaeta pulveracea]